MTSNKHVRVHGFASIPSRDLIHIPGYNQYFTVMEGHTAMQINNPTTAVIEIMEITTRVLKDLTTGVQTRIYVILTITPSDSVAPYPTLNKKSSPLGRGVIITVVLDICRKLRPSSSQAS